MPGTQTTAQYLALAYIWRVLVVPRTSCSVPQFDGLATIIFGLFLFCLKVARKNWPSNLFLCRRANGTTSHGNILPHHQSIRGRLASIAHGFCFLSAETPRSSKGELGASKVSFFPADPSCIGCTATIRLECVADMRWRLPIAILTSSRVCISRLSAAAAAAAASPRHAAVR